MVMSCTERFFYFVVVVVGWLVFFFFKLPFRKQVFIFVNAPYEFRSLEERLAALQPVITSDRRSFFSAAEVSKQGARRAPALFSAT